MKYSEKLAMLIEKKEISQSKLAMRSGLAQSAISEMTRDERRPYADQALKIARGLGVPVEYLIDDAMDEPPVADVLTPDELAIVGIVRSLGIPRDEAIHVLRMAADAAAHSRPIQSTSSAGGSFEAANKPVTPAPPSRKKSAH